MADQFMSRCGIDCSDCTYREQTGCPGCPATEGKLFWGECRLAKCCISKNHEHCGQCQDFPCGILNEFSYDPGEHGDNGERIRTLEAWNEKGYDVWRDEKNKQS